MGRTTTNAIVALLLLFSVGCGNHRERTYPTQVKVQLANGKPAAGARVMLRSIDKGISSRGVADEYGVAKMTTYELGDGAVAGRHSVAIGPPSIEGDPDIVRPSFSFAQRFSRFESSKLEVEVSDQKANEFAFDLTPN